MPLNPDEFTGRTYAAGTPACKARRLMLLPAPTLSKRFGAIYSRKRFYGAGSPSSADTSSRRIRQAC
jgi:hypothetical protein